MATAQTTEHGVQASSAPRASPPGQQRQNRARIEVVGLSVVLTASAWLTSVGLWDVDGAIHPASGWATIALAIAFGATLLAVFRIEFRGNAILFSLSEIPLTFALIYLDPVTGIWCRVLASGVVFGFIKRPPVHKQLFNLALFAFETSIAYLIIRSILDPDPESDVQLVLSSTAAVTAAGAVGSVAVAIAVSRFVGDTFRRIIDDLKAAWVLAVNAAMAGALLSLFLISPTLAMLAIVPVVALWYMMRRHGLLGQQLRDLRAVHGFASRIGRSLDLDEIGESAVTEASRLLRADFTTLAVAETGIPTRVFSTDGFPLPAGHMGSEDWQPILSGPSVEVTSGAALASKGFHDFAICGAAIVAMVDDDIGVIGVMVVAREPTSTTDFTDDDVDRARSLADQLASSLRRSMLHRQIEHEARHDLLTGLPNRLSLQRYLAAIVDEPDQQRYIVMMDLDRFKEVNDTLGHHAGDDLLIEFTRRISEKLSANDFLARLAGDEFAAVIHADSDEGVTDLAHSCINVAAEPVTLDGLSLVVTASVGIARIPTDSDDPELALRHADVAMYNAKSRHVGVEFFRPELDRRTPARLSMLGDLRQALDDGEISVAYQPKLDLASGMITGAEALARWHHHARGDVPPSEFVRVAEDTGLIKQLTDTVLAQGIKELRRLQHRGHHLSLSVNLSTHDLLDAKLSDRVAGYLSKNRVDPGSLTLEITESSLLVEAPRSRSTIHELNELGVHLSIDDFGTGYSSLSYLRQLPVSELKVDRSFIANMIVDQQDEVIVRSTIDLGHNLGLEVVAEGVECEQILQQLRDIGCDVAQGYTISRPLNPERFATWLNTSEHPSRRIDPMQPEAWTLIGQPAADAPLKPRRP